MVNSVFMGLSEDSDDDISSTLTTADIEDNEVTGVLSESRSSIGFRDGILASTNETVLATAGYDHTIKLWNISTALCIKTFQHPDSQVNVLSITPDRKIVAAGGYQHVRIYDVNIATQNPTLNLEGITKNVTTLGFNKNGQWMFTGGEDYNARIWDLRIPNPQCQKVFQTHSSPITCAVLHPSQTELIVSDQSGTIHCWDLRNDCETEQLIPDHNMPTSVSHVDIDPLGNYLAAVNNKGDCYVWTLQSSTDLEPLRLRPFNKIEISKRYGLKCYFSPDSKLLATTSCENAKVLRSDFENNTFVLQNELWYSGQRWVWDCAFTGDSQYLLTASSDNMARLWSLENGQSKREYSGHQKPITCIAYRDPNM